MKNLFILSFLLTISISGYCQIESFISEEFRLQNEFQEVIETGLSDILMYSNAKAWIAKTYGDYKAVIQTEDESTKKLIIKGKSFADYKYYSGKYEIISEAISYTLTIECKDMKYRYSFSNLEFFQLASSLDRVDEHYQDINYHYESFQAINFAIIEAGNLIEKWEKNKEPLINRKLNKSDKEYLNQLNSRISESENTGKSNAN